jgi:Trypsin
MRVPSLTIALAVALVAAASAGAVTGSRVDGSDHPYAGALVVDGQVACSGVLVAATVFATAGHCAAEGRRVSVSFDPALGEGWTLLGGTAHVDAARGADLAVVVLDAAAPVSPAALPAAGTAGMLGRGESVTSVGYGYSSHAADGSFVSDGLRRAAESPVLKAGKTTLTLSTAAAGPCVGDSGGPQLVGDTVVSLTSTGSKDCSGKAEGYRLDTASARAFLGRFVLLP